MMKRRAFSSTTRAAAAVVAESLKLVSFVQKGQTQARPGIFVSSNSSVVDLSAYAPSVQAIIEGRCSKTDLLAQQRLQEQRGHVISAGAFSLLAPIPVPRRNVICVGKNYSDHVAEIAKVGGTTATPTFPVFFTKAVDCVVGPLVEIPNHIGLTKWLDYEAELAVIIGAPGAKDIQEKDALQHVFGYCIANDITARDLQKKHNQWFKGKSLDGSCPLGPFIVLAEDVPDVQNLYIHLDVNGEKRQDSNTSKMIFNVKQIIASLSQGMTLKAGDVILTGTPEGVGYAMTPPRCLQPGDRVRIEIQGLGVLENRVCA